MSDDAGSLIYLILLLVLVGSSLIARRLPFGQMVRMTISWLLIFLTFFVVFTFRYEFQSMGRRVLDEVRPGAAVLPNGTVRINKSADGHFWVAATLNGRPVRFMVDSGATVTSLSSAAAKSAGVHVSNLGFPVVVETANGLAEMRRAHIRLLTIETITRKDLPVLVSDHLGDVNLLGMNFLSSLKGWRVEGNTLILNP